MLIGEEKIGEVRGWRLEGGREGGVVMRFGG